MNKQLKTKNKLKQWDFVRGLKKEKKKTEERNSQKRLTRRHESAAWYTEGTDSTAHETLAKSGDKITREGVEEPVGEWS